MWIVPWIVFCFIVLRLFFLFILLSFNVIVCLFFVFFWRGGGFFSFFFKIVFKGSSIFIFSIRHRTPEESEAAKTVKAAKSAPVMAPFEQSTKEETDAAEDENSEKEHTEEHTEDTHTHTSFQDTEKRPEIVDTSPASSVNTDKKDATSSFPSPTMPSESEKIGDSEEGSSNLTDDKNAKDQSNIDKNVEQFSGSSIHIPSSVKEELTVEGIQDEGRKFCFDLSPRVRMFTFQFNVNLFFLSLNQRLDLYLGSNFCSI